MALDNAAVTVRVPESLESIGCKVVLEEPGRWVGVRRPYDWQLNVGKQTPVILVREVDPLSCSDLDADLVWLQDNARSLEPSSLQKRELRVGRCRWAGRFPRES